MTTSIADIVTPGYVGAEEHIKKIKKRIESGSPPYDPPVTGTGIDWSDRDPRIECPQCRWKNSKWAVKCLNCGYKFETKKTVDELVNKYIREGNEK